MDPIASFSGLASGIDFQGMVDQLIAIDSRPIRLYQQQIDDAQSRSSAWSTFRGGVEALEARAAELAAGSAFQAFNTSVTFLGASSNAPLAAQPTSDAVPGSYEARVVQLASKEKLGSDVFSTRTDALGIDGEFIINGRAVSVGLEDSLNEIVDAINRGNTGPTRSGVSASVLYRGADAYSIVLTADATGAEGVGLSDGSGGALKALGFLDATMQIKHQTSDGATSNSFSSSTGTVATSLGLTQPPAEAAVTIGGFLVTLDLAALSLDDIASAINTAAGGAGSSVTATVVGETQEDGSQAYKLDINGTTSFTDANGILETLGILEAGRSDVAQAISSGSSFTDGDATTVASASTRLVNLWLNGAGTGVQAGDTLTLSGTRGDGTTFSKTFAVGANDDLQGVVDALNSATDGFQVGDRTATASISAEGRLIVTDDQDGGSWLALDIVAHNEGGGTLDFGDFSVTQAGRAREIAAGQDAMLEVDGTFMTRSSNVITDAIQGVTLRLLSASDTIATIDVTQNNQATAENVQAFIQAFNDLSQWVSDQFSGAGAEEGANASPLSGDSVLRHMRDTLKNAMLTQLDALVGGDLTRFADIGIEINKHGLFDVDAGKLLEALERDPAVVQRLFGVFGSGSTSALGYISSGSEAKAGNYEVEISQAATRGFVTSTGFGGSYVDDGTPDTLTIRDVGSGSDYSVSLVNGMTLVEIIDALNTEFETPQAHQVQASTALFSDAVGTAATDDTLLQDLFDAGGGTLGVADGDVISISGTRADGSSFLEEFTVSDITTQTLGGLRATVAAAVGSREDVTWQGGLLTASALKDGSSSLAFSITSDNAGGGTLSFGTMDVVTAGRGTVDIVASDSGGELSLQHEAYGSLNGFEVSFTAGGADGSASLGLSGGTYSGLDVVGTIGGNAATGSGQLLTGADDTGVEGLMIRYEGADTGIVGSMLFSRGVASAVESAANLLLGSGAGSIDGIVDNIDPLVDRLNDRIQKLEARLEQRREYLLAKFARLEEALALAQGQSEWLAAQFANLPDYSRSRD
jgi:flagellar hook-associated protein 2